MTTEGGSGGDVAEDRALGRDAGSISDREVIGHPDMASQDDVVADARAARDPNSGHNQAAFANPHVVTHLHQVIELGSTPDDRVVDAPSIDARMGPDLNLVLEDAVADVGNADVFLPIPQVTEALSTQYGPGLEHHTVSDPGAGIAYHTRTDSDVIPDLDAITKRDTLSHSAACTQADISSQHGVGCNGQVSAKLSSSAQSHRGIDPKIRSCGRIQCVQHLNQGAVRIWDYDPDGGAGACGKDLWHQHRAGTRPIQLRGISPGDGE
jgi:hypothetical protein